MTLVDCRAQLSAPATFRLIRVYLRKKQLPVVSIGVVQRLFVLSEPETLLVTETLKPPNVLLKGCFR